MQGILARVGQNVFQGGVVNHWRHSERCRLLEEFHCRKQLPRPCVPRAVPAPERRHSLRTRKMPKFVCWKAMQFTEEFEQLVRDGFWRL